MMNKKLQKTLAVLAMVGFMGTTSLVNVSEAASMPPQGPAQTQMQNQSRPNQPQQSRQPQQAQAPRMQSRNDNRGRGEQQAPRARERREEFNRRPNQAPVRRMSEPSRGPRFEDREHHSDTGNLVTGLIIGGILGAVIANNS